MRPASAEFLRAVRSSHVMTTRARLVPAGQSGVDPDGEETPIVAGDVVLDATAKVRGTLDLTTLGTWPTTAADPLAPYGQEVFVERGLKFGNGVTEWVSLGYFRLEDTEQRAVPRGGIRLTADDRMRGIVDARLMEPRPFAAADTYGDVFAQLVGEVYPAVAIEWDDATDAEQLGRQVVAEKDRHGFLADLIDSRGKLMFFDYRGVLVIRDAPAATMPVDRLDAGEGGVLVEMSRALSRTGVYNAVVAVGEAPDTAKPVRAVAVDNNPDSPTYFYGPFGPVPRFYSSPFLTTEPQCASAARAMLARVLGLPYTADLSAVPNPALEPLDPVEVAFPDKAASTRAEAHVLESLTVPLTPEGALEATTREQTFTEIEVLS